MNVEIIYDTEYKLDIEADKIINDAKTIAFLMSNVDNMPHHPLYVFGIEGDDHVYSSYVEE